MKTIFFLLYLCFFIPLALLSQNAPVTTAGRVSDAVPGDPAVPLAVAVKGFSNIGQFILTMKFDTTRVHYVSAIANPSLPGMTVTYTSPSGNTQGKLVFAWTGAANVSLADGSSLADLTFHYISGTGILAWAFTYGSVCQYKRYAGSLLTILSDTPQYLYYLDGGISSRGAPVTIAPALMNPAPGAFPVTIMVNGFTDISALTLYLEYNPAIITYLNSFTKNPAFDSNFIVGDNPGSGDKRLIVIQWYGSSVNLVNASILCTLNFNYPVANCDQSALSWYDIGPSCEYADGPGDVLIDMPQADYYINGLVAEGLPVTWTGNVSNVWDDAGNWNGCGMPGNTRDVVIPDVSPNAYPVIAVPVYCKSIIIQPGATLYISSGGSITVGD